MSTLQVQLALSRSDIHAFERRDNVENLCAAVRWMTINISVLDEAIELHTKTCEPITLLQFSKTMAWFTCDVKRYELCCPSVNAVHMSFKRDQGVRDTLSYALKLREAYTTDVDQIKTKCAADAKETKATMAKKFNFLTPIAESGCTRDEWLCMLREIDNERARLKKRERELDEVVCAVTVLENLKRCIDCPVAKRAKH